MSKPALKQDVVLEMLREGKSGPEIRKATGVSSGYVSRVRAKYGYPQIRHFEGKEQILIPKKVMVTKKVKLKPTLVKYEYAGRYHKEMLYDITDFIHTGVQ